MADLVAADLEGPQTSSGTPWNPMVPGFVARWRSRALVLPASIQTVPSDQPTRPTSGFLGPR